MLIPITALRAGARRLGAGDFSHRIDVHTRDELEELADQFNSMAGQLHETYSGLEPRWRSAPAISRNRSTNSRCSRKSAARSSSSLDLNAVLPTVAARALEITHADAVLIYGYDAAKQQFNLTEAIGIDKSAEGAHLAIDEDASVLGEAAARGEPIAIPDLDRRRRSSVARRRGRRRISFGAGGAAGRPAGHIGIAGGAAPSRRRILAEPDRTDADLRASIGAGDAQRAAVHRSGPEGPRTGVRAFHRAAAGRASCRSRPSS